MTVFWTSVHSAVSPGLGPTDPDGENIEAQEPLQVFQ